MKHETLPAQGSVDVTVGPVAWADDAVLQGRIGNCASTAAKKYWERGDWVDKTRAERLKHPLYAIPDGWQLIPKEPTPEMLTAGERESDSEESTYETVFFAMLSAAPKAPNAELWGRPTAQLADGPTRTPGSTAGTED